MDPRSVAPGGGRRIRYLVGVGGVGPARPRRHRPHLRECANPSQSSTGIRRNPSACRDVHGAARRGLACDRTSRPEFRKNPGLRHLIHLSAPTDRRRIRKRHRRLCRCRRTATPPPVADAGARPGMAHGVGFGARPHRARRGHRIALPGHGDLLRPRRDSPRLEVLASPPACRWRPRWCSTGRRCRRSSASS